MREETKDVLKYILRNTKVPTLDMDNYQHARDQYPVVVVHDTLLELGVDEKIAKHIAEHTPGCVSKRFKKCCKELGID